MISPKSIQLIIQHFDSIDRAIAKRLMRQRPWSEPALTSLLCDLLDSKTQEEENLSYPLADLNRDLMEIDGLLSISFSIETHEYDMNMERWVTQADLGLIIRFEDHIIPQESWASSWLLQAKRIFPWIRNPLEYTDRSRFSSMDNSQQERIRKLEEIVGIPFIRFLLYCPRSTMLSEPTLLKLTHLRNRNLSKQIFDYTLGLHLRDELSSRNSSLSAGVFVTSSSDLPSNLGEVHEGMLNSSFPFSWFIASHFVNDGPHFNLVNRRYPPGFDDPRRRKRMDLPPDNDDKRYEWAEGIVSGDEKAIDRLCGMLSDSDLGEFPILPPHTLTIRFGIGDKIHSHSNKRNNE